MNAQGMGVPLEIEGQQPLGYQFGTIGGRS